MNTMRHITLIQGPVLLALLGVLLGWPSPAQGGTLTAGIAGQTLVHDGRVFNIVTGQIGSTTPFHASHRVYSVGSGRLVTTITTGADGRFRVALRPGFYRLVPDTMWRGRVLQAGEVVIGSYESARPVTVRVRSRSFAPLTITYERAMGF
jgi:hypothetical protein